MIRAIESIGTLPLLPALGMLVAGFMVIAIVGALAVARHLPARMLRADNDAKGIVLSVVGVLYAVVLGFVAIGVWQRFDDADVRTYQEAANLEVLYRDAGSFPDADALRRAIASYTQAIIRVDWPIMADGRQAPRTRSQLEAIAATVRGLPATTAGLQNVQAEMLSAARDALWERDARLSMSRHGLAPILWAVLYTGAIYTIGFSYLLGFEHHRMRLLVIGSLGAVVGMILYLTVSLDYPFRGAVHVDTDAYEHALYNYAIISAAGQHAYLKRFSDTEIEHAAVAATGERHVARALREHR
jgi:hypothetical protein